MSENIRERRKEIGQELQKLLSVLMSGTRQEVKGAKKSIKKLWHSDTEAFKKNASIVLEYLPQFDHIDTPEHQAAFASGLDLFFLALDDEHFSALKDFTLKVIQHPNGSVREAIRKTAAWLRISLSSRAEPFVYPAGKALTEEQIAAQVEACEQYMDFIREIEALIDQHDDRTEMGEYIDNMKPSVHKSLQLLWSGLTDGPVYRRIVERTRPAPYEIFMKRKEIEQKLSDLLRKAKSDFGSDDIKEIIYNEESADDFVDIMAMFDTGQSAAELQSVLELLNDAWNYFPHKVIHGLSPAEKLLEYRREQNS